MRKIVVINRLGIGDVVLTTPLAQLIKEAILARVGFVVAAKAADLLANHPYIDDVFAYTSKTAKTIAEQIRELDYQEAVIVDERLSSTLLAMRSGCQLKNKGFEVSLGKKRFFGRQQLARRAIMDYSAYINYIKPGVSLNELSPVVGSLDENTSRKLTAWLTDQHFGKKRVLIVPQGLSENKNWDPQYFSQVNQYLNRNDIIPMYIGSKSNYEFIAAIDGKKINGAGHFSLRELAYIAHQADLCISVCTGPMHVIATAKIPIIALYGPTAPDRWAPTNARVIQAELPCIPCGSLGCSAAVETQCMQAIRPEIVIDAIKGQLHL